MMVVSTTSFTAFLLVMYKAHGSGQTPLVNSLQKTLEHDMEWLDNESTESMYTQTTSNCVAQDCISALARPNLTYGLNSQPFAGASGRWCKRSQRNSWNHNRFEILCTTNLNQAFEDAAQRLLCNVLSIQLQQAFVVVKLKNMHPLFECLVFPVKGQVDLFCNYSSFQPFVCSNGAAPVVKICTNNTGLSTCMLYYPSIKPSDALEAKLNSKIKEGMTRSVNFMHTETVTLQCLVTQALRFLK
jgi:hypothetical protein